MSIANIQAEFGARLWRMIRGTDPTLAGSALVSVGALVLLRAGFGASDVEYLASCAWQNADRLFGPAPASKPFTLVADMPSPRLVEATDEQLIKELARRMPLNNQPQEAS